MSPNTQMNFISQNLWALGGDPQIFCEDTDLLPTRQQEGGGVLTAETLAEQRTHRSRNISPFPSSPPPPTGKHQASVSGPPRVTGGDPLSEGRRGRPQRTDSSVCLWLAVVILLEL